MGPPKVEAGDSSQDPYKILQLVRNPNGTLTRLDNFPDCPPSLSLDPVLSKDLTIHQSKQTWARIYLPRRALHNPSHLKLPIIVFYHGGGFIFHSAASAYFHDFCVAMANSTQSLVVSVHYRLAPEHRLPAAYEDAVEALHWIGSSNDSWLASHADYSKCYLVGESAGGNIAYNAALRAAEEINPITQLKIQGMILIQPFFGGTKRTPSEVRLAEDLTLPLTVSDSMWELSLPVGADRDHEYSNHRGGGDTTDKALNRMRELGWRVVVFGCDGDPLVDREMDFVKLLKDKGVHVLGHLFIGGRHGIFSADRSMSTQVFDVLKTLL